MGYCADMESFKFHVKTEHFGKVYKKLEEYGYAPKIDDDGNVVDLDFVGDKIAYDEEVMFKKIATYVEDGSYIEMSGEDGARWRLVFSSGTVKEVKSRVFWDEE